MGLERTGGGISGTETRELMRRYNSLSSEERDRLEQVFPEFAHSSIDDIVKRFRSRAEAEGFKDLMEGIKRKNRNDEGYGSYLEEIMNELQHIKKEYGSRRKEGYRYRKEASKIQDAYSEIRKLKKDHDRKFNEDQMLSERLVRAATGYDNYEDSNKKFNRDSVREFFDKFK
jgi:predicted  nucleic acid-binding Zn-ribbon protein